MRHTHLVETLLKAGANGKAMTKDGKTALNLAKDNYRLHGTDSLQTLRDAAH